MSVCRWIDILYRVVPADAWRAFLIARHMDRCPVCQARLAGRDEARRLLVGPRDLALTPACRERLAGAAVAGGHVAAPSRRRLPPVWSWAAGAAGLLLLFVAGLWLFRGGPAAPPAAAETEERFALHYVRAGGAPARTYVFQSPDADAVFVWAERDL